MNQFRFPFLIQQTSCSSVLATDCALAWKLTRHSHYVQECQMMYRQECVHSHLNNVIFGKKSCNLMTFTQSAIVIDIYDCLPPPAILYPLSILNPTAPHCSLFITAIQILKWLEDIWKQEGIIMRLLENTRKHGLKNKNVKNELSLALTCIFYTNMN
jgi:hypothetical protein